MAKHWDSFLSYCIYNLEIRRTVSIECGHGHGHVGVQHGREVVDMKLNKNLFFPRVQPKLNLHVMLKS